MPTFTFTSPEGKSYTVNGPEGATKEQAFQILQQQLGSAAAPTAAAIPVSAQEQAFGAAQPAPAPAAPADPSLVDRLIGGGETALSLATGATGGTLGTLGGALAGIGQSVAQGTFGTQQGVQQAEQAAAQGASRLTYQPRTAEGQRQLEAVGNLAEATLPLTPLTSELGAIGRGAAAAGQAARDIAPVAVSAARKAAGAVKGVVKPATVAAPVEAAPTLAGPELASAATKAAEGSKSATQILAEQAAPDPKVVEAAKRLGIEDYLQPDHVTTNQSYRELAQAVKSIPGSEARSAEIEGLSNVAKRANDIVEEIGGTHDLSTLSGDVKNKMLATQTELEKKAEDLYSKVKDAIPAKTNAPATNTVDYLKQHADDLGGADRLLAPENKLLSSLSGDRPVTYAYLDQTRKQIGQALRKATGPFADSESGTLKKLYSTLSDDQQSVAEANGVGDLYNSAKASVAVRKGLEDDLSSLFGKNIDESFVGDLSGAVKALPAGDPSKFIKLVKAVPENLRQSVVASGLNTALGKSAASGNLSFQKYAQFYEGLLKNKQSYTALFSNLPPEARKQLSDLYRVSKNISAATRERITTGRISAIKDELKPAETLMGKLYDTAKRSALGATVGTAVGAVAGPGAGAAVASALAKGAKPEAIKAVDKLITSNEFINLAKNAGQTSQKKATLQLVGTPAWKRYAKATNLSVNPADAERWVTQAIQSSSSNQQR